jgi:mono/diheme cytochrome c family protein
MKPLTIFLLAIAPLSAATIPMNSERGEKLFDSLGCVQCHKLKGMGGTAASDLGRILDRGFTPDDLAGSMWNHGPQMWSTIRQRNLKVGPVDDQAAADLFAAFFAVRYFEPPGDAGRGKQLFHTKSCDGCHGLTQSPVAAAKPVSEWSTLPGPVTMVAAMWNHSPAMWSELSKKKASWPSLNAQEMTDLLVYLRNASPAVRNSITPIFFIPGSQEGEQLFQTKGCASCHKQSTAATSITLTAVAAAMWNHATFLHMEPPRFTADEMRAVLGYYWAGQFFANTGDVSRGRRLFTQRRCTECHTGSGPGPVLSDKAGTWNGITVLSALWLHGPSMEDQMKQKNIPWPTFRAGEMADVIAFINSKGGK